MTASFVALQHWWRARAREASLEHDFMQACSRFFGCPAFYRANRPALLLGKLT
jgi:hypothetical protein